MTKKKLGGITIASIGMLVCAITLGYALSRNYETEFGVGETDNGTVKEFDVETEILPIFDESSSQLLMPLRRTVEELGGSVNWDDENQLTIINYKGNAISIEVEEKLASINNYSIILDTPPKNINGNLYVGVDFISTNFGTNIEWIKEENKIVLKTEGIQTPIININLFEYTDNDVSYRVEVPVITGLNDKKYEKQLNSSLLDIKMGEIREFALKSEIKAKEDTRHVWRSNSIVTYKSNELISIVWDNYKQTSPNSSVSSKESMVIDLQSQKVITLSNLFKRKNYYNQLEKELNTIIKNNPNDFDITDIGEITGNENFYIKDGNLVVFENLENGTFREIKVPIINLKKHINSKFNFLINDVNTTS